MRIVAILCSMYLLSVSIPLAGQQTWRTRDGIISFRSDAPLELIEATSHQLQGAVDPRARTFAFAVEIATFAGFNSPLQREHFNENYLESRRFPKATFSGRFIEDVNLLVDGVYDIRAKGQLVIHGVEQERIIRGQVRVQGGVMKLSARFSVLLQEHGIAIPRIVYQKIAEEIAVEISGTLSLTGT